MVARAAAVCMEFLFWVFIGLLAALELSRLAAALAVPSIPYRVLGPADGVRSPERFAHLLSAVLDTPVHRAASVEVFVDGERFYPAQLEAIRHAQYSIHLGAYIFKPSPIADRFIEALTERAAAGVEVRLLLDSFGSFRMPRRRLARLEEAGGCVAFYHPIRWNTWTESNHRNHQNLLVIDGLTAFIGGAGVDLYWEGGRFGKPPWHDSVFRVTGEAVAGLQAAFTDNWLEASGELLDRELDFPLQPNDEGALAISVNSSPSRGGASRARLLFRELIHSAQQRIVIATPYFLPNQSAREEMIRAMRERGVKIDVLVPGRHSVPFFTRRCSRRRYGALLEAGARIYEYEAAMMHVKTMVVDSAWSVFGSTNFDPRSFGINDEVNMAVYDPDLARALERDFEADIARSHGATYDAWRKRPYWERATELLSAIFEQQQ